MSAISDYAAAVNTAFTEISDSVDTLTSTTTSLTTDFKTLKDTIDKLQNSPGQITADDQKLLDASQAQAKALDEKLKGVASALKGLQDATEAPPVPPAPAPTTGSSTPA